METSPLVQQLLFRRHRWQLRDLQGLKRTLRTSCSSRCFADSVGKNLSCAVRVATKTATKKLTGIVAEREANKQVLQW